MKRMWLILMTLTLALGLAAGCTDAAEPTPSPSPAATPGVSPNTASPGADVSPVPSDGSASMTIPNFLAGTVVALEELPEQIRAAIDREYPDGKVQSVTHAEYKGSQVYSVTLTDKEGANQAFYIAPDGAIYSAAEADPSASPAASPAASPKA